MCEGEGGGCTQRDFTGAAHTWVGWGGWGGDEMSTKSTEVADISSWMNKFNIFGMTSKYGDHLERLCDWGGIKMRYSAKKSDKIRGAAWLGSRGGSYPILNVS